MDEKMKKFVDAIINDAIEQKEQLLKEIDEQKCSELSKAEEEILSNIYLDIKAQIADIKNNVSKDISKKSLEIKNQLLQKRDALTSIVYDKLKEKLLNFVASNDYKVYVKQSIERNLLDIGSKAVTLIISMRDYALFKEICENAKIDAELKTDDEIVYGGFIILSKEKALRIDETIDEKLRLSHEYFGEISGLVIN
jgi:vacuolar-type H+-ATPase subunit E/Vma4